MLLSITNIPTMLRLLLLPSLTIALRLCNETTEFVKICSLKPDYESWTPTTENYPRMLKNSVTIVSVSEFNEDERTISVSIHMAAWWNDTRLSISSDKVERYIFYLVGQTCDLEKTILRMTDYFS